jgi:hypothetical protein
MFTLNKPSQISPHIFAEFQRKWAEIVKSAEKIILIGIRPHVADIHIWQPLEETKAKLYFTGSKEKFDEWSKSRKKGKSFFLGGTFKSAGDRICEKLAE